MKKIIFLNWFYPPDTSATSELLASLTSDLADESHDIHVIASRQQNTNYEIRLPTREVINGVTVHRVWTSNFGRKRLPAARSSSLLRPTRSHLRYHHGCRQAGSRLGRGNEK